MHVRIVDASALGALVFNEPDAKTLLPLFTNALLHAPVLLWYEFSSIYIKKIEKYSDQQAFLLKAYKFSRHLPIEIHDVDHLAVADLAMQTGLSVYDTSYLWLTMQLGGQLITLDKTLLKTSARFT